MRLRALPLMLVLTGCDYVLWTWSIADGHDVLSLVSGLTLLPLLAATLALLAIGAARLVGFVLELRSARTLAAQPPAAPLSSAPPAEPAAREQTSRRLAA